MKNVDIDNVPRMLKVLACYKGERKGESKRWLKKILCHNYLFRFSQANSRD